MTKINKTLQKWMTIIDNKVKYENAPFTEHEVIYLRKALGPSGLKSPTDRDTLRNYFNDMMPQGGYNITVDHQTKGINYLMKNTYTINGSLRKNNIMTDLERCIMQDFSHFKFVGLFSPGFSGYQLPLYECISAHGNSFTYTGNVYSCIRVVETNYTQLKAV